MATSCSPRSRHGAPECSLAGAPFLLKYEIRCQNRDVHKRHKGNILAAVGSDGIFVQCRDADCKRWTKIKINIPGVKFDLRNSGIVMELLPPGYHLDMTEAAVVISERE